MQCPFFVTKGTIMEGNFERTTNRTGATSGEECGKDINWLSSNVTHIKTISVYNYF